MAKCFAGAKLREEGKADRPGAGLMNMVFIMLQRAWSCCPDHHPDSTGLPTCFPRLYTDAVVIMPFGGPEGLVCHPNSRLLRLVKVGLHFRATHLAQIWIQSAIMWGKRLWESRDWGDHTPHITSLVFSLPVLSSSTDGLRCPLSASPPRSSQRGTPRHKASLTPPALDLVDTFTP